MIVIAFVLFVLAVLSVAGTATMWSRRLFPDRPWSRLLATGTLAILEVVVVSEVLGGFGLLRRGPLTLAALAVFVATSLILRDSRRARVVPLRWPLGTWPTLLVVAFGAGLLAVSLGRPTANLDTLQYHYPLVAHWLDVGNLTTPKVFAVGIDPWYYPSNANLLQFWSVAWFERDFLVSVVSWAAFGLAGAASIGVCLRLGARLGTSLAVSLGFLTVPVVVGSQLRSGQVDLLVAAFCAISLYFGLCWWQQHRGADAFLAGAAAGLAAGTKYVALPYALAFALLFVVVVFLALRRGSLTRGAATRTLLLAAGGAAAAGLFFYVRNMLIAGNPLFPGPVLGLPGAWMPANLDKINVTILDYLRRLDPHPWIVKAWLSSTWVVGLLALAGLVAVPLLLWRRGHRLDRDRARTEVAATGTPAPPATGPARPGAAVAAVRGSRGQLLVAGWIVPALLLAGYVVSPTSAGGPIGYPAWFAPNVRYGMPFLLLGLAGLIVCLDRLVPRTAPWLAWGAVVANAAHAGAVVVGLLPGAGATSTATIAAGMILGAAATAAAYGIALLLRRRLVRPDGTLRYGGQRGWILPAALACVAFAAGTAAAWHYSVDDRFGFFPADYDVAFDFVQDLEQEHPEGVVIAFSNWPQAYPFWGSRLQNTVLAAADEHTGGPDENEHTPGVGKPLASAEALVAFVDSHGVQYFVAREDSPLPTDIAGVGPDTIERLAADLEVRDEVLHPRDVDFALSRPDVFEVLAHSGGSWVFRVVPPDQRG